VESPIKEIELNPLDEIWEFWQGADPISGEIVSGRAQVFGEFDDNYFLETETGIKGWWRVR
jgi:hypothetical protein